MSTIVERSFRILEELSAYPEGRTLSELATEMDVPLSATHRLLNDLIACGYVRRDERHGEFTLTMQVVSLGLRFLSASGIVDVAQPSLERLAAHCGELVRLASVDDDRLIYVAKAQGATQGLRYDPEMGRPVRLACSAAGFVWFATKTDEEALRLVAKQGFGDADGLRPGRTTHHQGFDDARARHAQARLRHHGRRVPAGDELDGGADLRQGRRGGRHPDRRRADGAAE